MKNETEDNEDALSHAREVTIMKLNTTVRLVSTYEHEDMEFLIKRARSLLDEE